ncbi:MAG: hypothetical protein ACI956_001065, partial [Nonlabens sp.]
MTKQQKYALFLTIAFFIAAIGFDYNLNQTSKLDNYGVHIQETLQSQEASVLRFFDNKEFIQRQLAKDKTVDPQEQLADYEYISQLAKKEYTVLIYQAGKLIFWNNQYAST